MGADGENKAATVLPEAALPEGSPQWTRGNDVESIVGTARLQVEEASCSQGNHVGAAYIDALLPGAPIALAAIHPDDGTVEAANFPPGGVSDAQKWIDERNGIHNVYFNPNEVRADLGRSSRAKKEDIVAVRVVHVDVDALDGESPSICKARTLKRLDDSDLALPGRPTAIVDSGNGLQLIYRLKDRYLLDGSPDRAADMESRNRFATQQFVGGDLKTPDISRLLRVPGTENLPTKVKRGRGRVQCTARVLEANFDRVHSVGHFKTLQRPPAETDIEAFTAEMGSAGTAELRAAGVPERYLRLLEKGTLVDEEGLKQKDNSRSQWRADFVMGLVKRNVPDEVIYGVITNPAYKLSQAVLEKGRDADRTARRVIKWARDEIRTGPPLLARDDYMEAAAAFLMHEYSVGDHCDLIRYNGDYLRYNGAAYVEVEVSAIEAQIWTFLDNARVADANGRSRPYRPNKQKVANVLAAVEAQTLLERQSDPPRWLRGDGPPPSEIIACKNGLLHVSTGELLPPTNDFFTRSSVAFEFDKDAPQPKAWLAFLHSLWSSADTEDQIDHLQEVMGYLLSDDTSQQKAFSLVGPPRSGKGTIARIITELVAKHNTCSPPINSLGSQFGLQPFIGKKLAIFSDMRMDQKSPKAAITENILRVTGEDAVTIDRKYKEAWTGRLSTRFLFISNQTDIPRDESGALAKRFLLTVMFESFMGREDPALTARLCIELPSILNWSLDGLRRLRARGYFTEPKSSAIIRSRLNQISQPIASFIEDCCVLDRDATLRKEQVYDTYRSWCGRTGRRPHPDGIFFRNLYDGFPMVSASRPMIDGERVHIVKGLKLAARNGADRGQDEMPF